MPNIYMSKKAKAEARTRRRRKAKLVKCSVATAAGDGGGRDGADAALARRRGPPIGVAKFSCPAVAGGKRKRGGGGSAGGPPNDCDGDGDGGEDVLSAAVSRGSDPGSGRTVVRLPAGLTGKELRKFRKDARRRERAKGRDPAKIRFLAKGEDTDVDDEVDGGNEGQSSSAGKKRKHGSALPPPPPKRVYPRINDLLAADEERKKVEKAKAALRQTIDSVPMEERAKYVALDCEMVGTGPGGKTSVLARVSLTDWDGSVLLDTFVQVPERVTDFRTFVSGVTAKDIRGRWDGEGAMDPTVCRNRVAELLEGKVLIGHALRNDLGVLMLTHPKQDIRDSARYRPFMRPGRRGGKLRPRKLRDLVKEHVGLTIQEEGEAHSSMDDAKAAMELYKYNRRRWERDLEVMAHSRDRGRKKKKEQCCG